MRHLPQREMVHGDGKSSGVRHKYTKEDLKRCQPVPLQGESVRMTTTPTFTERLPKERFGNGFRLGEGRGTGADQALDYSRNLRSTPSPHRFRRISPSRRRSRRCRRSSSPTKSTPCGTGGGAELCHPGNLPLDSQRANKVHDVRIFRGKYCGGMPCDRGFPYTTVRDAHQAGAVNRARFWPGRMILAFHRGGGSGLGLPAPPAIRRSRQPAHRPTSTKKSAPVTVLPLDHRRKYTCQVWPLGTCISPFKVKLSRSRKGEPGGEILRRLPRRERSPSTPQAKLAGVPQRRPDREREVPQLASCRKPLREPDRLGPGVGRKR